MKLKTIGVMGSGKDPWRELAGPLGAWIAHAGHNLLTGGGHGVMAEVARAFVEVQPREGRSIGILPARVDQQAGFVPFDGYPNPFVEISIVTPLPRRESGQDPATINRNHVNVLSSDVIVALPGGQGTAQEMALAQGWGKPLICYGPQEALAGVPDGIPRATRLEDVTLFLSASLAGPARS